MRAVVLLLGVLLAGCAGSCATGDRFVVEPAADLVIQGATLIDGTGAPPRKGTTLWVRDGLIVQVDDGVTHDVPAGVRVIDVGGRFVMPGLIDAHAHFGSGGMEPASEDAVERALGQFLFYGVTSVLNVGGSDGSADAVKTLRDRVAAGEVVAPRLYATGGLLTLPGSHPIGTIIQPPPGESVPNHVWASMGIEVVSSVDEARAVVRRHAAAGMDAIKIIVESGPTAFGDDHPQMPPEMIRAVVDEADRAGLAVLAHVSSLDELVDSVEGGVRALMHAVNEPYPAPEHWRAMREHGVFYVPTLSLFAPMLTDRWTRPGALDDPFLRAGVRAGTLESVASFESPMAGLPASVRATLWTEGLASIGSAHEAGVAVVAGTDTGNPVVFPGYSMHLEMELLVEAGLTPSEAITAATLRPAELLGRADEIGSVAPGMRADLLILGRNPLEDIRNTRTIEAVILNGEVVDRTSSMTGRR